jgi:hypothetical protein
MHGKEKRRPKKDGSKKLANRKVGLKNIWWMNASSDWWKMDDIWESLVACTNLHMLRKASANEETSANSQKTLMGIGHTENLHWRRKWILLIAPI